MANCQNPAVVFLDIDGVLNTPEEYAKWNAAEPLTLGPGDKTELLFAPRLVKRLNRITETTGADIVISSSWRLYYGEGRVGGATLGELYDLLKRVGVTGKIVGPTPVDEPMRWQAIDAWLRDWHGRWLEPRTLDFAVLDDDVPHEDWEHKSRHVHCRALPGGLTEENERQAIELLLGSRHQRQGDGGTMSKQDGTCNYCRKRTDSTRTCGFSDVIVCSDDCDTALVK